MSARDALSELPRPLSMSSEAPAQLLPRSACCEQIGEMGLSRRT
jgi:hypothetical protein